MIGAFLGAGIVYTLFPPVIKHFNTLHHTLRDPAGGAASAGVFFPHPGLAVTPLRTHHRSGRCRDRCVDGVSRSVAINPARDFGPRSCAYLAGWSPQALPSAQDYWWIPIVGPLVGGVVGGGAYHVLSRPSLVKYQTSAARAVNERDCAGNG